MLQKVFVLENFESSNIALNSPLIANYWGSNFGSIKFLGHTSYLNRLAAKTGYFALKVTRIYDQDGVDGHWVSFDLADIEKMILNDYGTPVSFGLIDNSSLTVSCLSIRPCAIAGVRC